MVILQAQDPTEMKTELILKGVLLYATLLSYILTVSTVEYLFDNRYLIPVVIVLAIMTYSCNKVISEEEMDILSLHKFFDEWLSK